MPSSIVWSPAQFRRRSIAMTEAHLFVIGILLAWLAGIRVYLTVFGVGLAGLLGWVDLPPALQATESWWVLGTSAALAVTEFFADKIPGVDSAWDLVQTGTCTRRCLPCRSHAVAGWAAGYRRTCCRCRCRAGQPWTESRHPCPAQYLARACQQLGGLRRRGHRGGRGPGPGPAHPWIALIVVLACSRRARCWCGWSGAPCGRACAGWHAVRRRTVRASRYRLNLGLVA